MTALTKVAKKQLSKHIAKPTIKAMVLDTHDGAYLDASVKVKPHRTDDRKVVLKCTDRKRLAEAAKGMGVKPCSPLLRGSKHWILVCWKAEFAQALLGAGSPTALPPPPAHKALP